MITLDVIQGSDAWFKARSGIPTASCFDKIITSTGKASTQHIAYSNKLVAEYAMQKSSDDFRGKWMERGTEVEPEAREYYQFITDNEVEEVGLIYKDENRLVSCSPDCLTKDKGLEIKCPIPSTQVEYLLKNRLPPKYVPQVQGSMWVTGLKQWDFLSYHPDLPPLLLTIDADEDFHNALDKLMSKFIETLLINRDKINNLK